MADPVTALSITKDFGVPLVAAVVGALAAYLPSTRLARKAAEETLARDREQRAESELAEARRAFVKLTLIANTLGSFHAQVEEMVERAQTDGNTHMPTWQRLSTFAGIDDEPAITFDASELAPFIAAKRPEVIDDLLLLQRRHLAVVHGLRTFAKLKTELHYMMVERGTTTRDENQVSTTRARVPRELANLFHTKADELEIFADALRRQLRESVAFAQAVAERFDAAVVSHFGKGKLPVLTPLEAEPAADDLDSEIDVQPRTSAPKPRRSQRRPVADQLRHGDEVDAGFDSATKPPPVASFKRTLDCV